MNIYWKIASYGIAIGLVLGGLHWYGSNKYEEGFADREAIAVKAESEAKTAAEEKRAAMQATADKAKEEANERAQELENDAIAARTAADRLRNENSNIRRNMSSLTEQAIRQYANAASVVLDNCTAEYQSMAGIADKIDNDRRQLEEAWPQ